MFHIVERWRKVVKDVTVGRVTVGWQVNTVEVCAMSTGSKDLFKCSLKGTEHISHNSAQTPMVVT